MLIFFADSEKSRLLISVLINAKPLPFPPKRPARKQYDVLFVEGRCFVITKYFSFFLLFFIMFKRFHKELRDSLISKNHSILMGFKVLANCISPLRHQPQRKLVFGGVKMERFVGDFFQKGFKFA
jgi:hypothetical protein